MIAFTEEQHAYINSPIDNHIYLEACPGSGKTEVVAAKVANELLLWDKYPGGMALLSFSKSATIELKERIASHSPCKTSFFPHFVGTFDSFIYKHIVSPLAHEITGFQGRDGDYSIRIVENTASLFIQTKYAIEGKGQQKAHQYDFDIKDNCFKFNTDARSRNISLNSLTLKGWQVRDLQNTKKAFYKAGFATYRDIEHLAIKILETDKTAGYVQHLSSRFPLVIIDECQDLSQEQISIIEKLTEQGVIFHFIGDLNQSIYAFRNSDPQCVVDLIARKNFVKFELTENFRSVQEIVDTCCSLVNSKNINGRDNQLVNSCLVLEYQQSPTEVIGTFLELTEKYKNRVIVARGHSTLAKFTSANSDLNKVQNLALAITIFDKADFQNLNISITLFSEFIRDSLKESVKPNTFNCPESIDSPLLWRKFLFDSLEYLQQEGLGDSESNWKDWSKQANQSLANILKQPFTDDSINKLIDGLGKPRLRSPNGLGGNTVGSTLKLVGKDLSSACRKETIHQVKGETHEATMLVSSARKGSAGSHWKEWLDASDSEEARLAYVASSRPKHLLIWAVKKLKEEEKIKLKNFGFKFFVRRR